MRSRIFQYLGLYFLICTVCSVGVICQGKSSKTVEEIKDMIKRSQTKDLKVSSKADDELSKLTADSIPNLFEILKKDKPCIAVVAAESISELNPNHPELVPTITKLVRGATASTLFNLKEDLWCRRKAAYLLPASVEGLKAILDMLKTGDTWEKHTAVYALDDFTEVGNYNERPGEIEVMKDIVPALAKLQNPKDKTLKAISTDVLKQIGGHPPKELADSAKNLVVD